MSLSKVINSGNVYRRLELLAEEVARVKYGKSKLLTDFEFNYLTDSFTQFNETKLFNKYKKADEDVERALTNLQGLYFNILLNHSNLTSCILMTRNIESAEDIINSVLSQINDKNERKKAANECVKFNRLVFSDKTVDKEGFVSFNLNTNNNFNLLTQIKDAEQSLYFNLTRLVSWKKAVTDYIDKNQFDVKTYNEQIQFFTDNLKSFIIPNYREPKIDKSHYDWFWKYVLASDYK